MLSTTAIPITSAEVLACKVPTDEPESDGTLEWDSTTAVIVRLQAGGQWGLGYTFSHAAAGLLIREKLAPLLVGQDVMVTGARHRDLLREIRNLGRPGLVACAISALDVALWDLKAQVLGVPLFHLFGAVRGEVPLYGSGGFTSYTLPRLQEQLSGYARQGMRRVKMKVGRHPEADPVRVRAAREAIGPDVALMVDGNGAYAESGALAAAEQFASAGVDWFEEPVSSDDLDGLKRISDRAPPGMEITAGEYGYEPLYFRRMLAADAVHVIQADATRCLGYTGFLKVAALCEAFNLPLSAHTAPHLHLHCCCAAPLLRHIEYFHDHVRIAELLLDGAVSPQNGALRPDRSRPGHGLTLKRSAAERYLVSASA
jgi:L-alanine-DL-glutamate epimerase-like enolase superfamily enzyme